MRSLARTLLVVLGLAASLREAGSAACASTCGEPAVPCPLLEPTPQALVERAPVARALPEPAAFASFSPLLPADVLTLDAGAAETGTAALADRGIRPRAGPLWLLDRRLLL